MDSQPLPHGLVQPRYATPRNLERPTYGGHMAAVSALLGRPYLPWQRYVADVAGEIDEHGFFVYSTIIVTAQRQVGKTTFDLGRNIQNCLMGPGRRAWYTAQSGQHASDKWRSMSDDFIRSPRLAALGNRRLSNGSESITFRNGSTFRPHPPTEDSLHSKQGDTNTLDEIWAFTKLQGDQLLGAITPTFGTRRMLMGQQPQLWLMSTEGTAESTFANPIFDAARKGDHGERTAFFDFGIPFDADPEDLDTVAKYHPGYNHIFDMQSLIDAREQLKESPGEFARAYGNIRTGATERVIPREAWENAKWHDQIPTGQPICFGAAVGVDAIDATITVSTRTEAGNHTITTIVNDGHQPGTWWVLDRIKELHERHGAPFAIDRIGPSSALHDEVNRAGIPLIQLDSSLVSGATQRLTTGVTNPNGPTWHYAPHPAFETAAELATRRWIGDGAWVFGRRASIGSISALEAATLSSLGLDHLPEKVGIQLF